MSTDPIERTIHEWLAADVPTSAPASLYGLVESLPRTRWAISSRLWLAPGLTVLVLAAAGLAVFGGGPGPSSAVGTPSAPLCLAGSAPGTGLAMLDPSTVTGQRLGVTDKPGDSPATPWPNPELALTDSVVVAARGPLTIEWSDGSHCLGMWQAYAVPYYSSATAPAKTTPIKLGAADGSGQAKGFLVAPPAGDWIVGIDLSMADGRAHRWYFRLRANLPGPSPVGPSVTPARPCGVEDPSVPPKFVLETADGGAYLASPYGSTWGGQPFGNGSWLPTSAIPLTSGTGMGIAIEGDVCAIEWTVLYGSPPARGPGGGFFPEGDLVPAVVNRDPSYASQNQFALRVLPKGTWLIAGTFGFVNGEALVVWEVTVK
jgi:hypothetical protein